VEIGAMNSCQSINYAGKVDWRAPTIKEPATLSALTCSSQSCDPWSSTRSNRPDWSGQITQVFAGGLASDIASIDKTTSSPLRCVRGGNVGPKDPQKITVTPSVLDFG
jgi:hypothetical protein